MEKRPCSGYTSEGRMGLFPCSKNANRQFKGKWWCVYHDPREQEKKYKARVAKWDAESKQDDDLSKQADKLLRRLGVKGGVAYHWKLRNMMAVTISFDEVEKLLKELGR